MSTPLARAYLEVIPSLEGAANKIRKDLEGIMGQPLTPKGPAVPKSWSQQIQSVGKQWQSVGQSISGIGKTMTKYITAPAVGAAVALGGVAIAGGFKRLVGIDTAQAQLKALGHDTKSIEGIMTSALDSVKGTSFGLDEAATAASTAVAAGIPPGKQLTKYLKTMGDAAAISNVPLAQMAPIFNGVQTAQRAYLGDLNQLATAGLPIFQWIADEAGVTADKVRDMASTGQISSELFFSAIEKNIGGAALIMGEESFTGAWANMRAAVNRLGAAFLDAGGNGGGFFSQMKPLMGELTGLIDNLAPAAEAMGVAFGQFMTKAIEAARNAITWWMNLDGSTQKLILSIAGIAIAAGPVLMVLGNFISTIGGAIIVVGKLAGSPLGIWLGKITAGLLGTAGGAGGFLSVLLRFAGPIGIAVSALILLWSQSETFRQGVMELAATVWDALKQIGSAFMDLWSGAIQPIISLISTAFVALLPVFELIFMGILQTVTMVIGNIVGIITGLVDVITGVVQLISAIFRGDWAAAWDAVKQIVLGAVQVVWNLVQLWILGRVMQVVGIFGKVLMKPFQVAWTAVRGVFTKALSGIRAFVTGALNGIRGFTFNVMTVIRGIFSTIWGAIRTVVTGAVRGVRTGITVGLNAIRAYISFVLNFYRKIFSTAWNAIRSVVTGAVNGVRSAVSGAFNAVRSVVSSVMSAVRSIVTSAWNAVRAGARAAVNGMRSAVSGGFSAVTSIVRNLPSTIRGVFSNAGGLLLAAGRNIIQGLTKGIQSAIGGAINAVKGGVQKIRNLLPFSPAKEGPLSGKGYTLYSGQALMGDFGKGIANQVPGAVDVMESASAQVASALDGAWDVPDYLPESWSLATMPDVARMPSGSAGSEPATAGAGPDGGGRPIEVHANDPHLVAKVVSEELRGV